MLQTSLRISMDLYKRLARLSKKDRRSINSEIIYIIEKYFKLQEIIEKTI